MAVSNERLKDVVQYYIKNGEEAAVEYSGLSHESLNRYIRSYKVLFGDLPLELEDVKKPNILIVDIETMPILAYVWGIWQQNVGLPQIESDWFCATWSCKWLNEPEVYSDRLTMEEMKDQNDKRIMQSIWKFLEAADVVIAHNGVKFDIPRMQTRFLKHGILPPLPYQQIDTLRVAKKQFAITSNKLDYIGKFLGVGQKIDTGGFELWRRVMQGEQDAIIDMEEYNKQDVLLLEQVYLKLRPYIKSHPNWGLFTDDNVTICPTCGSAHLDWDGQYSTSVGQYSTFRCLDCGSVGRARVSKLSKAKRASLCVSVAR